MKTEETKLTFYGNQAFAMLPLVGYILIGGTFSVGLHYYSMKGDQSWRSGDPASPLSVGSASGLCAVYRKRQTAAQGPGGD